MKLQDPGLPVECWVSIIQGVSRYRTLSVPFYLSAVITSSVTTDAHREPICSQFLKFCIFAFDCIHVALRTRATALICHGVSRRSCGLRRDRQAVIYGAVGRSTLLDPTPTQSGTTDLSAVGNKSATEHKQRALKEAPSHPPVPLHIHLSNKKACH